MNHDDRPMWDDPAESSRLRQLLRAGRDAPADYNVERGVVRHLANLQAGVALPEWAASLPSAKAGAVPVLAWLAVPFLAATAVVGVWLTTQRADVSQPVVTGATAGIPLAGDTSSGVPAVATSAQAGRVESQPLAAAAPAESLRKRAADSERPEARAVPSVATKLGAHATPTRRVPTAPEARAALHAPSRSPSTDARGSVRGASPGVSADLASGASALSALQHTAAAAPAPVSTHVALEPEPEPVTEADVTSARHAPHAAAAATPSPDSADSRLEREMQMLAVTQRVLTSDPSRALRLARQGEREFSGSMFSAERRQLALLALVRLGQLEEARRLGRPFLVAYPNAPWSERLRRALATGQLPLP